MTDFQVGDRVVTEQGKGILVDWHTDSEGEWLEVVLDGDPDATVLYDLCDVDIEYRPINDPKMYDRTLFD